MLRCTPAHVAATEQHDQEHEQHQKQHRATVDGATAVARQLSGPRTLRHGGSAYPPERAPARIPGGARSPISPLFPDAVCHTYNQAGVRLVLIDEIHRLNPRTTTGAEAADLLKDFSERIRATFVYAGIDVTTTPLFSGVRGAQLAARASLIHCGPLPARHGQSHPFHDLTTGLENALDLNNHRPGTLPRLTSYLHMRTAGRIGALTRLIRQAAITDGTDGTEKITKAALDTITLDHQAEQQRRPTR
jgi:hypothetical protein